MAPNIGQGANMAIEDAAILSSLLSKAKLRGNDATMKPEINRLLQEFSKAQRARTKEVCDQSEFVVRMQSNADVGKMILGRYLIPFLKDVPAGLSGMSIKLAPRLDYVDLPSRSLTGGWRGSWIGFFRILSCFQPRISSSTYGYLFVVVLAYLIFFESTYKN